MISFIEMIKDNPIFQKLLSLNLPQKDYAVFGSGPLLAHGLIKEVGDVDIVARGKAWELAKNKGKKENSKYTEHGFYQFFGGDVEIANSWGPGEWDIDKLINEAKVIEGIRFVDLRKTLEWKKKLGREKDKKHIRLIEEYLGKK